MLMRNLISVVGVCSIGVMLAACGSEAGVLDSEAAARGELAAADPESQCGPGWDVQDVERYDGSLGVTNKWVQRHEGAVGYLVGTGCTGTLISDDLFISAGHCSYVVGDTVRFNYQLDPTGAPRPTVDHSVVQVVEQERNASRDYAIVRLNGTPGATFGYVPVSNRDEPEGNNVIILQHPAGVPKKIHAGPVLDYASPQGANWFRHQVDTINGSSGSGVLSEDGFLVGIHTHAGCDPGNSAVRISHLATYSPTLRQVLAWQAGAHAWVWASDPTNPSYPPPPAYQWNTSGATNTITRSSTGVYQILFPSIGASGVSGNGAGGNVQVTAYGTGAYCKVSSWSSLGADVTANIRCFDFTGAAKDARFTAVFNRRTFEGFADEHGTGAYLWSQSTSYTAPTGASGSYSWNDSGQINTIEQPSTGRYVVRLPKVDDYDASVHVTAYGSDDRRCQVQSWGILGANATVNVRCSLPNGTPADSRFTISFGAGGMPLRLPGGHNATAYTWVTAAGTVGGGYTGNDLGGPISVDHTPPGTYVVHIPKSVTIDRDSVLVTAYGVSGQQCSIRGWFQAASEIRATVGCVDASGSAADSAFTLSYVTPRLSLP
jgi:V8-like Glu-specific endopeptidase